MIVAPSCHAAMCVAAANLNDIFQFKIEMFKA